MRKFIDGTIRIPDRAEIVDRTKVVIIQDVNSGSNDDKYCSYKTLFEGLYRAENDGNYWDNHNPFKSTGRYQTIPTVYALKDDLAKSIPVQVNQSAITSRWGTIEAKQEEFNKLYPSDYYGNCYVGRNENTWITYHPNKTGGETGAVLNLKYNTCKTIDIKHQLYGSALINEYSDHIDLYMNNFDEDAKDTLKTETIVIAGAAAEPTFTYKDRGVNQTPSILKGSWNNGEYTLTVQHNGSLDISIQCAGNETGRLTAYKTAKQVEPAFPDFYTGARQYEGGNFDMKNIEENVTNGCRSDVTNFQGMGFVKFGTKETAAVKDTVRTTKAGEFEWTLRYSVTANINNVDLYVNGGKIKTLSLLGTSGYSDWKTVTETITLKAGENKIELKANANLPASLYLDNFKVEGDFGDGTGAEIPPLNGKLIQNLKVYDKENGVDWSIYDNTGVGSVLYGDRDLTAAAFPENLVGAETIRTACDSKMLTTDLGVFTAGADITVYVALDDRVPVPAWLSDWYYCSVDVMTSNDVALRLFKKNAKSGDQVLLGTNGGYGDSANYIVMAVPEETVIKGDVNLDGVVDVFDLALAKRGLLNGFNNTLSSEAADVNGDAAIKNDDVQRLQEFILANRKAFSYQSP